MIGRFLSWLVGDSQHIASANARMAWMDRAAERQREDCEICNHTAVYICPECREPISDHSHENDYICKTHSFVSPIRLSDGAHISGDGQSGDVRVLS
jgi:hypothetical protein